MFSSLTLSICDIWMFKFYFSCFFSKKIHTQCLVIENCQNVPKSFIMLLSVRSIVFSGKKISPKPSLLIFHSVLSLKLIIDCDFFLLQVPFFGRNTRKALNLENDQSNVSRLKAYLTLN